MVVPDGDDADLLNRLGRTAFAMTDTCALLRGIPIGPGSEVLCVGLAQTIAGDLHNAGVETILGIHVPPGHFSVSRYLTYVAEQNAFDVDDGELHEIFVALEEGAFDISDTKPTGHPDLPGADPHVATTRRFLKARLRNRAEILATAPTRWLVKNYATCGSVLLLGADPNLGKSTLVNAWGHCIWTGNSWLSHDVRPGGVVFILGEDMRGASLRAKAWEAEYGPVTGAAGRYFEYADRMPQLCEQEGQLELRRLLLCLQREYGEPPVMVVIDTLSTVWGTEPENSAELAARLMAVLSSLAEEFGCTFVLVHHLNKVPPGHNGKPREITLSSIRGAGAFVGSADDVLVLEDTGNGTAKLYGIKARNTDKAPPKLLRVHRVALGLNEDGDEVSSVILIQAPPAHLVDPAATAQAEHAAAWRAGEAMVDRAVEALRMLGCARSRTAIVGRMAGKRSARFAGVDDAMTRRLIIDVGTKREPKLVVAADHRASAGGVCKTPHTPEAGTGNRSPADAGPGSVPSDAGTGSQVWGTGNQSSRASEDDGLPEQPKRSRRAKAGSA